MVAWTLMRPLQVLERLPGERRRTLRERLRLTRPELDRWDEVTRRMFVPFHEEGTIISQFEGYEELEELDWEGYRERYGDIHRLDRILEAEGDSPNRSKLSKQADVVMLFFLLPAEELAGLFARLGYAFDRDTIPRNVDYYMRRTSHGSTLSRLVHSWVLARGDRRRSWGLAREALESDIADVQGGTTEEGIHLGALAGTIDLIQRGYGGVEPGGDVLRLNPALPSEIARLRFPLAYRGHRQLEIDLDHRLARIRAPAGGAPPIAVGSPGRPAEELPAGHAVELAMG